MNEDAYEEILQRLLLTMNIAPDSEVASTLRKFPPSIREQMLKERTVDIFRAFGSTRIETLISETHKGLRRKIESDDRVLPFTFRQCETLLGFSIDLSRMLLLKLTESDDRHARNLKRLVERIDALSDVVDRLDVIEEEHE